MRGWLLKREIGRNDDKNEMDDLTPSERDGEKNDMNEMENEKNSYEINQNLKDYLNNLGEGALNFH